MNITLRVELLAGMDRGREPVQFIQVPEGIDTKGLMERLEISQEIIWFITVNGQLVNPHTILKEGDVIKVVPLVDGG